jgi:hypothetical protein
MTAAREALRMSRLRGWEVRVAVSTTLERSRRQASRAEPTLPVHEASARAHVGLVGVLEGLRTTSTCAERQPLLD